MLKVLKEKEFDPEDTETLLAAFRVLIKNSFRYKNKKIIKDSGS